MYVIRLDQNDISSANGVRRIAFVDFTFPFDNVDLMFIRVVVQRCVAPGGYLKLPHGEVGGPIVAAE
jgi:hypothetical protein